LAAAVDRTATELMETTSEIAADDGSVTRTPDLAKLPMNDRWRKLTTYSKADLAELIL